MKLQRISEFGIGLVFGLGLIISGMTDPSKVLGFLDLAGLWDPSLAFVMGSAILVGVFAFAVARKRTTSVLGGAMQLPTARHIDRRLVLGSLLFGAGWGIAGFAPGRPSCRWGQASPRPWYSCWPCWQAWAPLNGWRGAGGRAAHPRRLERT